MTDGVKPTKAPEPTKTNIRSTEHLQNWEVAHMQSVSAVLSVTPLCCDHLQSFQKEVWVCGATSEKRLFTLHDGANRLKEKREESSFEVLEKLSLPGVMRLAQLKLELDV